MENYAVWCDIDTTIRRIAADVSLEAGFSAGDEQAFGDGMCFALQLVRLAPEYALALVEEWLHVNEIDPDQPEAHARARMLAARFPVVLTPA